MAIKYNYYPENRGIEVSDKYICNKRRNRWTLSLRASRRRKRPRKRYLFCRRMFDQTELLGSARGQLPGVLTENPQVKYHAVEVLALRLSLRWGRCHHSRAQEMFITAVGRIYNHRALFCSAAGSGLTCYLVDQCSAMAHQSRKFGSPVGSYFFSGSCLFRSFFVIQFHILIRDPRKIIGMFAEPPAILRYIPNINITIRRQTFF